jgi:sodium/proline symporter
LTPAQILILITMAVYMIVMIAIGLFYTKKSHSSEDFFLGGRRLGPWVTAMSAEASDMSSWLMMGLPGLAYLTGFGEAGWTAIGLAVGTYLNWLFVSKRLRRYSQIAGNAFTLPDFFSNRYHDNKRVLMSLSAFFIIIFFAVYTASGFVSSGILFNTILGFDYVTMMLISAAVIVIYTALGGFLAESMTDFIQGLWMIIALVIITIVGIIQAGGFSQVIDHARSLPGYLDFFSVYSPAQNAAVPFQGLTIVSTLAWGLGYFGMPHILLRFMAIRQTARLRQSRVIATVWVIIALGLAVLIGLIGSTVFPGVLAGRDSERIFIFMSTTFLAPVLAGIMLSGILAATMSTSDSQLLITSSSISQNFLKGILKKDATERQVLWIGRIAIVVIAIVAAIIAFDPRSSIFDIVSHAWAGFGATFGPLMLFSLFWRRTTFRGALAGMISGALVSLLWPSVIAPLGGVFAIYELLPAFIFSAFLIIIFSLTDKKPNEEIIKEFELARSNAELDIGRQPL